MEDVDLIHSLIKCHIGSWYDLPAVEADVGRLVEVPPFVGLSCFFYAAPSRLKEAQKGVAWPQGLGPPRAVFTLQFSPSFEEENRI